MKKLLLACVIVCSVTSVQAGWLDSVSSVASAVTKPATDATKSTEATGVTAKQDTYGTMNCAQLEVAGLNLNKQITQYNTSIKQKQALEADPDYQNQQKLKAGAGLVGGLLSSKTGNAGQAGQIATSVGSDAGANGQSLAQDQASLATLNSDLDALKVYQKHAKCLGKKK